MPVAGHTPTPAPVAPSESALLVTLVAPSDRLIGGHAVQARTLRRELAGHGGADVHFVETDTQLPRGLRALLRVRFLRTAVRMLWFVPRLIRAMRRSHVTHVFSAAYWAFVLVAGTATALGRLLRRPVIINYHSGEADDHLRRSPRTIRWILTGARELVVPSRYLRDVFRNYGYRSIVVPNAVDGERFPYRVRRGPFLRFLCTRNLEPCYDIATAVKAFRIVADAEPRAVLTIVGSGSQAGELHHLVHDLDLKDQVRFVGAVPHDAIASFYADGDIYLNPAIVDNQPLSVLEAMASGLVVISTAAGGVGDLLSDGAAGYLVPCGSPDSIAAAATRVMHDGALFTRLTEAARSTLRAHEPRTVVDQWLGCYRRTASSMGSPVSGDGHGAVA